MNPILSVIIPIYKVELYLERCIISVLNQDYKNLEVILIDDGSPDRCPQICDEMARRDERVKVIHKENGGLSSARNAGIRIAKGEYLAFLDSDDQWGKGKLRIVMEHLQQVDVDMLVFDTIAVYPEDVRMKRNNYDFYAQELVVMDVIPYYKKLIEIGDFMESACTKIIKRSFLAENRLTFYEGITGEDSEWMIRLLRKAKKIAISNVELFLCTCRRPGSIQNSIKAKNIRDLIGTIDKSLEYYKCNDSFVKRYELEQCAYLLANATGLLMNIGDKAEKKELKALIKQRAFLFKYGTNRKLRKVRIVNAVFGFDVLVQSLEFYMFLLKKNMVNKKRDINE